MSADSVPISRRSALVAMSAGLTSLSGCLGRPWSAWERDSPSQIELEILAPPEDEDNHALRIARHLGENLESAGIHADVLPTRTATLLRDVLINYNFDLYVWRLPPQRDPDLLRALLHSRFAEERGWQNPFGFSNTVVDDILMEQLRARDDVDRAEYLAELQRILLDERPFVPILFEEERRMLRPDRVGIDAEESLANPSWFYGLHGTESDTIDTLRLGSTNSRVTNNLNPIAVEYRGFSGLMGLVYEAPARRSNGDYVPRLAEDWEWTSPEGALRPTLEIRLREGLNWHDGTPLTSDDVRFTYAFLRDTSLNEEDPMIPSPRFRVSSSLLDTVEAVDPRTIRIQFHESRPGTARQLLTLPILPAHVWEEWTSIIEVAGIQVDDVTTDALVVENLEPVGSGPYEVSEVVPDDFLRLELIEDHPLADGTGSRGFGLPEVSELIVDVRPSTANIIESMRVADLDGSLTGIGRATAADLREDDAFEVTAGPSSRLFHVGFNLRGSPLSHAGFRTAIEPLLDREYVREEMFSGTGRLSRTGVHDEEFIPSDLQWVDGDALGFAGVPGSGEIDVDQAREGFRDAGFSYSGGGELLGN